MRLIDADDFKKFLQALCNAGAPYEEVIQLLDKQPTAYDVEAVVAELEASAEGAKDSKDLGKWSAYQRAISIVRGKE